MKTIKEAAKARANDPTIVSEGYKLSNYNSFKAGVEFAQQWISIDEELPEKGIEFLGTSMDGEVADNDLHKKDGTIVEGERVKHILFKRMSDPDSECIELLKSYKVTHWRKVELI